MKENAIPSALEIQVNDYFNRKIEEPVMKSVEPMLKIVEYR